MKAPQSAAERMRAYRRRRRQGALSVRVGLVPSDIAALVKRGYLESEARKDLSAIEEAADTFISDSLHDG